MRVSIGVGEAAVMEAGHVAVTEGVDFPELYRRQWRGMVRLAVLLVDDASLAEDLVQDAFVALHRQQHALRSPHAATAYLRASVVNLSRSALRRRIVARKHATVPERDEAPAADANLLLSSEHPEVLALLRALPQRQREVLVLRYWNGVPEAEIAEILGISVGTVKSSANRGIAALRGVLEGAR